jgi:hypothetical protein
MPRGRGASRREPPDFEPPYSPTDGNRSYKRYPHVAESQHRLRQAFLCIKVPDEMARIADIVTDMQGEIRRSDAIVVLVASGWRFGHRS